MWKKGLVLILFATLTVASCGNQKEEENVTSFMETVMNEEDTENTIEGRWKAITERPGNMKFHGMYFPKEMEFWADGSFTEYYSEKDVEGTYVLDNNRLKIIEDMSAGVRDRVWKYEIELAGGSLKLIWEDGTNVEYTKIYEK